MCQANSLLALDMALKPAAAQMNIEGGNIGLCGNGQLDCSTGGDYVEIYDGKNAHSPLLGHVTGDITDDRTQVTPPRKALLKSVSSFPNVSPQASKNTEKNKSFRSPKPRQTVNGFSCRRRTPLPLQGVTCSCAS